MLLTFLLMAGVSPLRAQALATQEIRYKTIEAGEVFLVWGIDGWQTPPPTIQPAGTTINEGVAHTPMTRSGKTFSIALNVPPGTVIDYGFLITKAPAGTPVQVWDGNNGQDYHTVAAMEGDLIEIQATPNIVRKAALLAFDTRLQWQGFLVLLIGVSLIIGLGGLHRSRFRQNSRPANPVIGSK